MNSLGRKRISKAQLIYNIDRNMKSSSVPEPELINNTMGEKRAKTILLTSWKTCGNKDEDAHCLRETKTAHKAFKGVNFKDKERFLRVVRRGLTRSYKVKLLQMQFELHIRNQFPAIILIRSTE